MAETCINRILYVLLAVFLGTLGVHNFVAGYMVKGAVQLVITLFFGWLIFPWFFVVGWNIYEIITVKKDADGKPFTN